MLVLIQTQVDIDHQIFLTFIIHLDLYKYKRLPFGIHCAPAIFQKYMAQLLSHIDNWFPYLDDIIIFSNTKLDYDKVLCKVLNLLQKNNVNINFKKVIFKKKYNKLFRFCVDWKWIWSWS